MIIYSFDVGNSTGICRADTSDQSLLFKTLNFEEVRNFLNSISVPSEIVVERMPLYNSAFGLMEIIDLIKKFGYEHEVRVTFISPSTWKPIAKAQKWKCDLTKTDHEHDAYCLFLYFITFIQKEIF